MVYFTCTHCGDAIQKPKVEKHCQFRCRNPISVTCMDCLKDFRGQEYVAHTKCISENQRYGGKDYVTKAGANKGERKQQEWIEAVHSLLSESTTLSPAEKNIFQILTKHENIPRKKAKFLNFARSVLSGRASLPVIESVWAKMEKALKNTVPANGDKNSSNQAEQPENNSVKNEAMETMTNENGETDLGKKGRKEKKSKTKKNQKNETTGGEVDHNKGEEKEESNCGLSGRETAKKLGKRGRLDPKEVDSEDQLVAKKRVKNEVDDNPSTIDTIHQNGTKKKKSKKHQIEGIVGETEEAIRNGVNNDVGHAKFDWKNAILEVVRSKGEVPLKKLRKKVIADYQIYCKETGVLEKAQSKFDKKFNKITEIVVNGTRVSMRR